MPFRDDIQSRLETLRQKSLYRELTPSQGISFVHNDYLGLSQHPEILEAGHRALDVFGAGSRGSRLLGGQSRIFDDVERRIAEFFQAPSCLFFSTGYLANLAAVQALTSITEGIVSDERNHASLIDGIRLTKKPRWILPHQRWDKVPATARRSLFITESLFSMDGDTVAWDSLKKALDRHDGFLLLDEAHAAGVFCEQGRGLSAGDRDWDRMACVVTFGKAFGVAGAAVLGSEALRSLLINEARSFIYTTAPSPVVAAMVSSAADVVERETWRRAELWDRAGWVRRAFRESGIDLAPAASVWDERSPVIPFPLPGEDRALRFCENMRESGIELRAIRYPTVPKGSERLRISINLSASRENTELMAKEILRRWVLERART